VRYGFGIWESAQKIGSSDCFAGESLDGSNNLGSLLVLSVNDMTDDKFHTDGWIVILNFINEIIKFELSLVKFFSQD
jgi:hypothetical protein